MTDPEKTAVEFSEKDIWIMTDAVLGTMIRMPTDISFAGFTKLEQVTMLSDLTLVCQKLLEMLKLIDDPDIAAMLPALMKTLANVSDAERLS